MKRWICLFFTLLFCLNAVCGCDLNLKPKTLEQSTQIPENGMIHADVFRRLKEENKVIVFWGESSGIRYEWTVFGSDIETPKDLNLKVEITDETENSISLRLCAEESFGFSPILSVYSSHLWNTDHAVVFQVRDGAPEKLCTASVTGSKNTILNFSVTDAGDFLIASENEKTQSAAKTDIESDDPDTAETVLFAPEPDPYLSGGTGSSGKTVSGEKQHSTEQKQVVSEASEPDPYLSGETGSSGKTVSGEKQRNTEQEPVVSGTTEPDPYLSGGTGNSGKTIACEKQSNTEQKQVISGTAEPDPYLSGGSGNSGKTVSGEKQSSTEQKQVVSGTSESDPYLSGGSGSIGRRISDGKQTGQDQYKTDPVPEGRPMPAEPENQQVDKKKSYTCTFSIECTSIFNNLDNLASGKLDVLPSDGIIFPAATVTFYEGESVYDVLQRVCQENGIHMEASWTPMYNSAYVEGICNLYEFDCGNGSGWMYRVNGWYPNYGCSRYQLTQGDVVEWRYTCDLGADIGGGYAIGS